MDPPFFFSHKQSSACFSLADFPAVIYLFIYLFWIKKTLTTSEQGKTAVSRKVVGKTRLSARVNPS